MGFRFRIGPFTFGRSGTRLSLWRSGAGVSVPLSRKGRSFGKIGFGPLSWYFGGSHRSKDAWRNDSATERQKSFANDLGIQFSESVTKGELADMISAAKRK